MDNALEKEYESEEEKSEDEDSIDEPQATCTKPVKKKKEYQDMASAFSHILSKEVKKEVIGINNSIGSNSNGRT